MHVGTALEVNNGRIGHRVDGRRGAVETAQTQVELLLDLGVGQRVDERVDAGRNLGEHGRYQGGERREQVAVAGDAQQRHDRVGRPRQHPQDHQTQDDLSDGHFGAHLPGRHRC